MNEAKLAVTAARKVAEPLPHVPRLSIAYFLAWTAVTAVLMAIFTLVFSRKEQPVETGEAAF